MIKYLKNREIDKKKWDQKVSCACNEILYAYSWYLDLVAPGWGALVWGDYEYIMPLPGKRKYGISYLFQPPLTQQLGIFAEKEITPHFVSLFLKHIPAKFLLIDLNLNVENTLVEYPQFSEFQRITYHLSLFQPYDKIYKNYNQNTKRNLKKSQKSNVRISRNEDVEIFFQFWKEHSKLPGTKESDLLEKLVRVSLERNCGELLVAFDREQQPAAICFFIFCRTKIIYLAAASSPRGRESGASFMLIDKTIQKYAEKKLLLDFEGSMIPSVARFYKGFGGKEQKFLRIKKSKSAILDCVANLKK